MANAMGVKLKLVTKSFPELLPALTAGEFDMVISNMGITTERNKKVAFVGPYFVSGKAFLTTKDQIATFRNPDAINSPKFALAALKNSTSQKYVQENHSKAKLVLTSSMDESVKMLLEGKVDALVADYPFCAVSAFRYKDKGLATLDAPLTYEPLGIALPDNDPLLVNIVENLLNSLRGTGDLRRLEKRWLKEGTWLKKLQ
jgi:polar amino acid transport system substrate-binding protein